MYKIFDTLAEYNQYTDNGTHLTAGILYLVKENKSLYFLTNNIDGETEKYEYLDEIPEGYIIPTGNIAITENGENIDIAQYATATVNVAGSGGNEDLIDLIERDITTFNIPSGTTKIGNYAFDTCLSLQEVTIPNSVTSIGIKAFYYCTGLRSITIPDSVTSIGDSAFTNCSGLTSINISENVKVFESYVFGNCKRLTSLTFPSSTISFMTNALKDCSGLTSITILATTPPNMQSTSAFQNTNNCPIYVPAESVDAYKAATNWSSLASRIQAIA